MIQITIGAIQQLIYRSIKASLTLQPSFRSKPYWLFLSLSIPLYYGFFTWHYAHQPNVIQDDARQHVVFLGRFLDTNRFAQDPIADYFQAVAPIGYRTLYGGLAHLGIEPLSLAKVLPIGLGVITSFYLFEISLYILPVPINGILSVLILNQQLWLDDSLVSATPRAFVYPIFTAFLYYCLHRNLILTLLTIALQGLFFPQLVLVQVGVLLLQCWRWQNWRLRFAQARIDYGWAIGGLLMAAIVLSPYLFDPSQVGSAITLSQMQPMPEYGLNGRNEYFGVNFWQFWLMGNSGLRLPWFPSLSLMGLLLPVLLCRRWRSRSPLVDQIRPEVVLLLQVILASLSLFSLAHLLLLKLHFPSRYTYHTVRIVLALAAGLVLTIGLSTGWCWFRQRWQAQQTFSHCQIRLIALMISLSLIVTLVPAIPSLFYRFQGWVMGETPSLYRYLAAQPLGRVVSILPDANNLPAFAQQSVSMGREFALPHHPDYYQGFQQRTIDGLQLLYSPDSTLVRTLLDRYSINFLLIENTFPDPMLLQQDWLIHSSFRSSVQQIIHQLQNNQSPAILSAIPQCVVFSTDRSLLLAAPCLTEKIR